MKVLVVSLKRALERREYITKHLQELRVDFEIVDAVDYQQMSKDDFDNLTDSDAVRANKYLTSGVLACAISHMKVYGKVVEENLPKVLVIEDDASLPKNLPSLLKDIESKMLDDEIIALSYFNHFGNDIYLSKSHETDLNGYSLVFPTNLNEIGSAMAYVITNKVAGKLVNLNLPVSVAADYWGVFYNKGGFTSFRCVYPVPVKPALFRSTIDYPDSKTIKSKIAAWVRKKRIPILTTYLNKRSQSLIDKKYVFHFTNNPPFNK